MQNQNIKPKKLLITRKLPKINIILQKYFIFKKYLHLANSLFKLIIFN